MSFRSCLARKFRSTAFVSLFILTPFVSDMHCVNLAPTQTWTLHLRRDSRLRKLPAMQVASAVTEPACPMHNCTISGLVHTGSVVCLRVQWEPKTICSANFAQNGKCERDHWTRLSFCRFRFQYLTWWILPFVHFEGSTFPSLPLSWCPNRTFNERSLVLFLFLFFYSLGWYFGEYRVSFLLIFITYPLSGHFDVNGVNTH